tara:strand:- start:260 stop:466 length:207 start_codon:yes stop_codon:yes gene_type:complete
MHQERYIQNRPQAPLSTTQTSTNGDGMKQVKISSAHYVMLSEQAKKYRMKVEDLIEELIQENYSSKKR